jgi:hypothetical protein
VSSVAAGGKFRELDDLVLHLKGLVLVRRLREQRGAAADELLMYGAEIDRVREQLVRLVKARNAA